MHIGIADIAEIDRLSLPELDLLRHQLGVSQKELCEAGEINPSTYQRWLRHIRGQPDGTSPRPLSIKSVRAVLKAKAAAYLASPRVFSEDRLAS